MLKISKLKPRFSVLVRKKKSQRRPRFPVTMITGDNQSDTEWDSRTKFKFQTRTCLNERASESSLGTNEIIFRSGLHPPTIQKKNIPIKWIWVLSLFKNGMSRNIEILHVREIIIPNRMYYFIFWKLYLGFCKRIVIMWLPRIMWFYHLGHIWSLSDQQNLIFFISL
jgi:hypothetical protein